MHAQGHRPVVGKLISCSLPTTTQTMGQVRAWGEGGGDGLEEVNRRKKNTFNNENLL